MGHASPDFEPERTKMVGNFRSRAEFAIGEFRMPMEIPPPLDNLGLECGRRRVEIGRGDLGVRGADGNTCQYGHKEGGFHRRLRQKSGV
jgi:hypothetical protein